MISNDPVLISLIGRLKDYFGDDLDRVVLFGSYARGEERADSDIDLFVVVSKYEKRDTREKLNELIYEYLLSDHKLFSIIVKDKNFVEEWEDTIDLFSEIKKDGKLIYAKAGWVDKPSNSLSGLISVFSQNFVKPGLVDKNIGRILTDAYNLRIESDYEDFFYLEFDEAKESVDSAMLFVEYIQRMINS